MNPLPFPPGLVLIVGGLLLATLRGPAFRAASLILPLLTLAAVWMVPPEHVVHVDFLDYQLTPVKVNAPTRVFATIFSVMAFGGALFALNMDRRVELPGAFIYAGSAIGVTFSGDLLTMFIFWELMAIGSTIVVWCGFTDEAREAGQRYVNVHLVGGVILMAGIVLQVANTGSVALPHYTELDNWASVLMLIGVLINAAAPPFGGWLADAYPAASESGTVFLSAFTTKTSVYVLMMLFAGLDLLIYVGLIMAIYGIVYAILENDMRRILGYSIVNQVGFMVCGIGIGTQLAINGACAHAFAHIIYKALLLMSAGSVMWQTGKRKCTDLGGLYRTMPVTMWCGIIGALAISAFPGTSGFTTKSMITDAAAYEHIGIAWFVLMAASAGVFLHAGIKFPWFVFFQKDSGLRPPDPPWNMKAAMILFSVACLVIGLYPGPLYDILPFPELAHEYHAYTFTHVIAQLELLLFAGLAFFVLLPMLKRTLTITLDFDWFYRVFFPYLIWKRIGLPIVRGLEPLHTFVTQRLPPLAVQLFGPPPATAPDEGFGRQWGVGPTVLLVTAMLLTYLVINLF